ncbi:hypothetical protein [Dethiobacter alkaliphilus]|uniref:hypothetical protein n=1 Tax=Dethiobacter alkaliphilus TaxID=427926 RepID=UPI002227B401|nr:hypothetical protein [Dethiobacter alkaliphilus]MCW3490870.1 hypothetical protein [Dethiobacter alkaliphilus]
MVAKSIYAFFNDDEDARQAMHELRNRGYISSIQKADQGSPNPDMSVSSLMVGFLPNMTRALFQSRYTDREGVYLFVGLNEHQGEVEVYDVIEQFDGELLEQNEPR